MAGLEPDCMARANFASLALIFAELTRHRGPWVRALEGWDVRESKVVDEWKAEGAIETRRDDVLRPLNLKFPGQVPAGWMAAIRAPSDAKVLSRWLDALFLSASPEEFQATTEIDGR